MEPRYTPQQREVSGWVGWIAFAAAFMVIDGFFGLITGFVALFKDDFFVARGSQLVTFNISAWGWIHIVFSVLLILSGLALMRGATWARAVAIVLVGLHMVAEFTFLNAYPVWSIIVIAIDALVLWALIVHGGEVAV